MIGPPGDLGLVGRPSRRSGSGGMPSQRSGSGREALPEGLEWLKGLSGGPEVVVSPILEV